MSHVTLREADRADQQVRDIPSLRKAVERIGMVWKEGQSSFRSWASDHGRLVGDYPLPEGYSTIEELQAATKHAIGLNNNQTTGVGAYEIGVIESRKFPGTYSLAMDFYGGHLEKVAGSRCDKLLMYYQAEAAKAEALRRGYVYKETLVGGGLDVEIDTTVALGY